jgi:hypothetical protein
MQRHYTWEEKIESLVKLAKRVDTFFSSREGENSLNKIPDLFLVRLASDDVGTWWHDEPSLIDEIKALIGQKTEYTDELTGILMRIDHDNPEYPGHPKISVICPEPSTFSAFSIQQVNEALHRLRRLARVPYEQFPDITLKEIT